MNGYIKVNINGQDVGLKFNMYAIEAMATVKGNGGNVNTFTKTIWGGYLGNCYVKQADPVLTFEEVADFVDNEMLQTEGGQLKAITDCFAASAVVKATSERAPAEVEEGEQKKT